MLPCPRCRPGASLEFKAEEEDSACMCPPLPWQYYLSPIRMTSKTMTIQIISAPSGVNPSPRFHNAEHTEELPST